MKLIKYKRKPKIPPLFLPLQNEKHAEFLRHLLLLQCDFALSFLTKDKKTEQILECLLRQQTVQAQEEDQNEKKGEKDKNDKKDKKKKEKEKKEKEKEKKKKDKKKTSKKGDADDINQDPNLFELPPIPVLTPEEEEEQKRRNFKKIFKWCIECFINRFKGLSKRPEVPIDYSAILPEFQNVNTLYAYAQMPSDDLSKVYQYYPYDFFKVCSKMTPKFANDFIIACLFNRKVPIPIGSRLISFFPLTQIQIDYTLVYEKRCHNFHEMSLLFEGLLCNCNNQLKAAEILAGDYEKNVFNDECVILINSSIRRFSHFIDKDLNKTIELFPSGATISFLIETATTPLAELAKKLKTAQPNEYITRLTNQITLLELLNLGERWTRLEELSVPVLLEQAYKGEMLNPEILFELPRDSIFFTYSSECWKTDFDFVQAFVAIQTMITEHHPNMYPQNLNYDLFSLLFMMKPPKEGEKVKASVEYEQNNEKNKDIMDILGKTRKVFDFYFDIDSALGVITFMLKNGHPDEKLIPYLEIGERKLRSALILYESPTINDALLTEDVYYLKSLKSLDKIQKITEIFGNPPRHVNSKRFSLTVIKTLGLNGANVPKIIPFYGRVIPGQTINEKVESAFNQALLEFPKEIHPQIILDFASSYKKLPLLSKKLESEEYASYLNEDYLKFISHIQMNCHKYPIQAALRLGDSRSIFDYKKRLSSIISCNLQNSNLDRFSRFVYALITLKSQSFYKFHNVSPQGQLQVLYNMMDSLGSLKEKMYGTGIEPIEYILRKNRPDLCTTPFFEKAVGEDPLLFIPFAQSNVDPGKLAGFITKDNFHRVKRYFEVCKSSGKSGSIAKEGDSLISGPGVQEESSQSATKQTKQAHVQSKPTTTTTTSAQVTEENSSGGSSLTPDEESVLEILKSLEGIEDKEEKMNILEDLLYNNRAISKFSSKIIEIIQMFPQVWCIGFIETFIALLEPEDSALIPLLEFMSDINPKQKKLQENASEMTRVQHSYGYLTRQISNIEDVIDRPEDYFRLCQCHLKWHLVDRETIGSVRYLCLVLICVRKFGIFKVREKEREWLSRYVSGGVSSITVDKIGEMIVDIGLNHSFECGQRLADLCSELDLCEHIKKAMPRSVKILSYVKEVKSLVTSILSEQKVGNEADEVRLLHFLGKIGSIHKSSSFAGRDFNANDLPLFKIMNEMTRFYTSYRWRIRYSGNSLQKLHDIAVMTDVLSLQPVFKEIGVEMSAYVKSIVENSYSVFGLVPSSNNNNKSKEGGEVVLGSSSSSSYSPKQKIFTSPKLNFDILKDIETMRKSLSSTSTQPTMYTIESTNEEPNYMNVYQIPLQKREIEVNYRSDFSIYEVQDQSMSESLRIGGGRENVGLSLEQLVSDEVKAKSVRKQEKKKNESSRSVETIKFTNMSHMRKTISDFVGRAEVEVLFEKLPTQQLQMLLKLANAKGLLHMILKISNWVEEHEESKKVFVFGRSSLKEYEGKGDEQRRKVDEFIRSLREVLLKAIPLIPQVDSSVLVPATILNTGNTKLLQDIDRLLEFQTEIGIDKVNLFASKTNKAGVVMKLLYDGEYEKGFGMMRILRQDTNLIVSKTVKLLLENEKDGDKSKVGKFMLNVVPRLDIDSAKKLIDSIRTDVSKSEVNKSFVDLLVSGMDDSRNVYQMLSKFGFEETAAIVAIQEGLGDEVRDSQKDERNKEREWLQRSLARWINQNKSQATTND